MLNRIIHFSIKNKLVVAFFMFLLVAWGIFSLMQLPVDALPDVTNNQVQVITKAPALAAQEVEQFITYPVERSVSNLPGLTELRSISRFGISVVTVVFDESTNIYFARQLINERLQAASQIIPQGMGTPELAPVTTGLGEIYQYTLHAAKGSEEKYNAMELRNMQDWIVARQLYGIPGVAEVTGFGGIQKQYEVSLDPARLRALNVSIREVYNALEKNNANTGGAYIEKLPNAYFIRGIGVMENIRDIEHTLVKLQPNGLPLLIRDVATVQFGHAPRYGAITYNGEKEAVGGIVLMLKGANSADVVARVKERMASVQASLPADVVVEPFLDRTDLINRAIATVRKNLIEGALIVIFVLVLFLGNLRAGLIVASAIPLSLLFAFGMMHIFHVSANLMSLGAIDFGLIVDGAVIIVEAIMHHLGARNLSRPLTQAEMDEEVYNSSAKIRTSAAFGEIIILIVYLPILSLAGIEGRMFRPMAETVGFAILGALVLSLTYIPMMSAAFLPKRVAAGTSLSDKVMAKLEGAYEPILLRATKWSKTIITTAVVLLSVAIFAFTRMGGEFIPQLEEGDFAIEFVLPQGASLGQAVATSLKAERMVREMPEVKMVVGKTGSADAATDPMPPQATDLIVVLKDKSEWEKKKTFYGLADEIEEKLSDIPGVIVEPSQPIQMRFNELMTGIKQDVAIKIFGENMDSLHRLANRVAATISSVPGITTPRVEKVAGLPQVAIKYDRARMANYGVNIEDLNTIVNAAFAGQVAGAIYENERRYELVVRLDSAHRTSITDVSSLAIPVAGGGQVPLSQVATVGYATGPTQISRDEGRRRIVISFNVDGRDVRSVVHDIQRKLDKEVKLPTGYFFKYGGTFENLEHASRRLMIAVPIALLLILSLLYFTFHSLRQALLIFSAIPMSAIGGVFALMMRGMPFSISAGVGFIALFGVAVLNGIVLIGTFNNLVKDGITNPMEVIRKGTRTRLRPVLMTAMVASLGFLPMALSHGAGAEVQRPLATVVIGGLVTATLLTLIVLPLLYLLFGTRKKKIAAAVAAMVLTLGTITPSEAQTNISFEKAYQSALENNPGIKAADIASQRSETLSGSSFNLPKTGFFAENEDLRPSDHRGILKIGVSQNIEWPGIYSARRQLLQQQAVSESYARTLKAAELRRDVMSAYYTLWYHVSRRQIWMQLDSFCFRAMDIAVRRVRAGESAGLDSIAATARSMEVHAQLSGIESDILAAQAYLMSLMNTANSFLPEDKPLAKVETGSLPGNNEHPSLMVQQQLIKVAHAELLTTRRSTMPDFSGRFFSQRLYGLNNPYNGFSVTMSVPLMGISESKNKIAAARLEEDRRQAHYQHSQLIFGAETLQYRREVEKQKSMLKYYEDAGLAQADALISASMLAYGGGEINFASLAQYLGQAIDLRRNHLDALHQYNMAAIRLNYLLNNNK
ncbi:MAG: CusA/CzcA family heavy metal efflux RND transporter [Taibaiella sp.]|nr:CusA/CzcA family heavy metal efflux RND transporter [Taibaiella sp.]